MNFPLRLQVTATLEKERAQLLQAERERATEQQDERVRRHRQAF